MELGYAEGAFTKVLDALKLEVFGRTDFVLHRRDIIDKEVEPFAALKDGVLCKKF